VSQQITGLFNFADRVNLSAMSHRLRRSQVISGNIANAETPGYRALGYDFEKQLQDVAQNGDPLPVKVSDSKHLRNAFTQADGSIRPEVFVRPTESVPHDGNTVDIDTEMAQFSENQILYRATVESLNRKIGMLRYAISGGR
jgi:flagellar basal-body rod protein FlgB